MATPESQPTQTFQNLSQQQLEVYALELYKHFHEERRLRVELEERNGQLEQRIRELASLNRLFQGFMEEYSAFLEGYQHISGRMEWLAHEAAELAQRARPQLVVDALAASMSLNKEADAGS